MQPRPILIIDDEEQLRKLLGRIITLEGFAVTEARNLREAEGLLAKQEFDVVLCDVRLPDGNGVGFVKQVKLKFPLTEIILLTAFGNISDGVQAMKNGAFDYITKGDDNDRIIPLLNQALAQVEKNRLSAVKVNSSPSYKFASVIGTSEKIMACIKLAERIAPTESTVLLLGETGTGKEVFANAIHAGSTRAAHPVIAINCSAFSSGLLESELFGHKAGAYTGAMKDKKGLIEVAEGGTLFLDEIGELDIELQAKLLRVLENGEFIKVGDVKVSRSNVRIIAATHRNLAEEIERGRFREDLLYRLNIFSIDLPPLRERSEDIPLLAAFFLTRLNQAASANLPAGAAAPKNVSIGKAAMQLLKSYSWKGNIRELKNVLERARVIVDGEEILPEHLPYSLQSQDKSVPTDLSLAAVEKMHIVKILQNTHNNKAQAARLLQIGLATLYRKMDEYNLPK